LLHALRAPQALATKALFCVQLQAHYAARAAGERLGCSPGAWCWSLWLGASRCAARAHRRPADAARARSWLGAAGLTWAGRRRA
jgi:hypothetical protein